MIGGGWGRGRREEDAGPGKGGDPDEDCRAPARGIPGRGTRSAGLQCHVVSHPVDSALL